MTDSNRLGWVDLSEQLLREVLHMPEGTAILAAEADYPRGIVRLIVRHDDLPEVGPNESIPTLTPTVTCHVERYEWNWNVQPNAASGAVIEGSDG